MLTQSIVTLARQRWAAILNPHTPEELEGVLTFTGNIFNDGEGVLREYALTVEGQAVNIAASNVTSIMDTTRDVELDATVGASVLRFWTGVPVGEYGIEFTMVNGDTITATLDQTEYVEETPEPLAGVLTATGDTFDDAGTIYREYALTVDGDPVNIEASNIDTIFDDTRDVGLLATAGSSVLRFSTEVAVGSYDIVFTLADDTVIEATLVQDEYVPE